MDAEQLEAGRNGPGYASSLQSACVKRADVKVRGHWQSDVLVGAGLGTAFGFYAHNRDLPLLLSWMPHGIFIGFKKEF